MCGCGKLGPEAVGHPALTGFLCNERREALGMSPNDPPAEECLRWELTGAVVGDGVPVRVLVPCDG
jgi:hypothetical protein